VNVSSETTRTLDARPDAALAAVRRAAEGWGAELRDGRLGLPIVAGLRRGWVAGPLAVEPAPEGSRLRFQVEQAELHVQLPAVAILLLAAGGGVLTALWPFFPELLPVAPFGAIFALVGWLLVVSRLRTSGPEEFLDAVAAEAGAGPGPDPGPDPGSEPLAP
jgi:hypothetical protein